ncbi:hypothetical protein [Mycolicibacterium mengxianglii]|uniref:hypothetical protein n=1 Tax=Mycolicibacterium mengxianglii TaxID=2736649 RepID=UPI0018D195AC|nr:hypothetical protein [Mycolicibacterium mengxianglii]
MTTITHVVVGPPQHGVVRFGRELHDAMLGVGAPSALWHAERPDALLRRPLESGIHLQFTDRLFGPTPEQAVETVSAIASDARDAGLRVTATLHDLPQRFDYRNYQRRSAAYAEVCSRLRAVVVSSEHERDLLGASAPSRIAVVPLPVRHAGPAVRPTQQALSIGIFGFVYPDKGHREVLRTVARLDEDIEVVAIGEVSTGHADLAAELDHRARSAGVTFRVTGHVPDSDVPDALRAITIPVAPHRHISASGSLNSWLAAGRRPLAPVNRYTEEIVRRNPDALELYPDSEVGLRTAIKRAVDEPGLTWLPDSAVCTPSVDDAAGQYTRLLSDWHR